MSVRADGLSLPQEGPGARAPRQHQYIYYILPFGGSGFPAQDATENRGNRKRSPVGFPPMRLEYEKRSDPIESRRKNLSGSWHSGRSQHEQYLGHAGSSVQDLPHRRHSKIVTLEPLQWGSRSLQASKTSMRSFVSRYVQRHSTPAEIPT